MLWPQAVKDRIKTGADREIIHSYPYAQVGTCERDLARILGRAPGAIASVCGGGMPP